MRRRAVVVALALAGCGGGDSQPLGPDGGETPGADAGASGSDAGGLGCDMAADFDPITPLAGLEVVARGSIINQQGVDGLETFEWSVRHDGEDVITTPRVEGIDRDVVFVPAEPGLYEVRLSGTVDDYECFPYQTSINVLDPAAATALYRLRAVPRADQPAPPQERLVAIFGGAEFGLGTLDLQGGAMAAGVVSGPDAAPLAAYLRARPTGLATAPPVEGFAGADGAVSLRLLPGSYDLLVVPVVDSVAPAAFSGVTAAGFAAALALGPGEVITGTVHNSGDQPVEGARVALVSSGVPSSVGVTDAAGAFALVARPGGATSLTVVPLAGSGLPRLDVAVDAGLVVTPAVPLAVRYAALPIRALALPVQLGDGASPAAQARVTLVAHALPGGATVTPLGGAAVAATASVRAEATLGASGVLLADVPAGTYDVVVEPPPGPSVTGGPRLITLDLGATAPEPAALTLAASATLTGVVRKPNGDGVAGARVNAAPRGLLAGATHAAAEAVTAADGSFSLSVVGLGEYDLTVRPPLGSTSMAMHRLIAQAPAPGESAALADIGLPRAIRVTGAIRIPGLAGGVAGVYLALLCADCATPDLPVAETVTGPGGAFLLLVPDPGTEP